MVGQPYYEHGGITIYHGDCRAILPTLEAGSVDLVLTDPPYNVDKDYGGYDDKRDVDSYSAWCREWFAECRRISICQVVFPGVGNLAKWLKHDPKPSIGCWYKPGAISHAGAFQWNEWEPFLAYGHHFRLSDAIYAVVGGEKGTGDHPCPKPLRLIASVIGRCRLDGPILDAFLGSGTTLVAAKMLGRKAIGIEINEAYCEIAANRLRQETLPLTTLPAMLPEQDALPI